jgi:hypothetical protein
MEPEVAVMVTVCVPDGVAGVVGVVGAAGDITGDGMGVMELEQPTTRPVETSNRRNRPRTCRECSFPEVRLREKARNEPKGRSVAKRINDAPLDPRPLG